MRKNDLKNKVQLQRGLKTVLAGGMTACLCMAAPAWATLVPLPMICIDDFNDNPTANWSNLGEITQPPGDSPPQPTVTYPATEEINVQFYTTSVFVPILGPEAVLITAPGGSTPSYILTLTVTALGGQESVNIFFEDSSAANFAANLAAWTTAGAPTVTGSPTGINLDSLLGVPGDNLEVCNEVGNSVPDSGTTLVFLGLGLTGVVLMHRRMSRAVSDLC